MPQDNNTAQRLLDMRAAVDAAKNEHAQYEGRLQSYFERLHEEFDCKTLAAAEKLLAKLDKQITAERAALQRDVEVLASKYNWQN